jgi:hypothetical protein
MLRERKRPLELTRGSMAETIEEFLVGIGVKFDSAGYIKALDQAHQAVIAAGKKMSSAGGASGAGGKLASVVRSLGGSSTIASGIEMVTATGGLPGLVLGSIAAGAALVGAASVWMAERVAKQFEKVYFAAQQGHSTVGVLESMEYGFSQIGLGAGTATQAIVNLGLQLKYEPGKEGLLNSIGVQTRDAKGNLRDTGKILDDLIEQLAKMPPALAESYAGMFGISRELLNSLEVNRGANRAAQKEFEDAARRMGVNLDDLGRKSNEFMTEWRRIWMQAELSVDRVSEVSLPTLTRALHATSTGAATATDYIVAVTEVSIKGWQRGWEVAVEAVSGLMEKGSTSWKLDIGKVSDEWELFQDAMGPQFRREVAATRTEMESFANWFSNSALFKWLKSRSVDPAASKVLTDRLTGPIGLDWLIKAMKRAGEAIRDQLRDNRADADVRGASSATPGSQTSAEDRPNLPPDRFDDVERAAGVPNGILGRVEHAESNDNDPRFQQSGAGAQGPFGLLRGTADHLGVKNPFDEHDAAVGAAAYLREMYAQFGDWTKAVAAYNWGPKHLQDDIDAHGAAWKDFLPAETVAYLNKVLGPGSSGSTLPRHSELVPRDGNRLAMNQTTHINVSGANDPTRVGAEVAGRQGRVNGNMVRWFQGAVLA